VSPANAAEPIEMPFGLWTRVGPRKHILDGGGDRHAKGQFLGERTCSDDTAVCSAKMAQPIEMLLRLWTRVGRRKHALHGNTLASLVNTIEPSVCCGDATLCQITLTTCYF